MITLIEHKRMFLEKRRNQHLLLSEYIDVIFMFLESNNFIHYILINIGV